MLKQLEMIIQADLGNMLVNILLLKVKIIVDKNTNKILGAKVTNYLLEKSRVSFISSEERNFHIFYHLISWYIQIIKFKVVIRNY